FLIAASVLFAVNLVITNGSTPLFDQDEAAYAGFAHTMVESGDWVTPSFLWSEDHRKPPLHFWAMAASMTALGPTLLAVRLPTTLAFVATCVLLAVWGAPLFGRRRALGAAVVLATSLLPVFAKIALCDGLLLTAQTAAALALLRRMDGGGARWTAALWTAVAAGLLITGPPVLILVGGMAAVLAVVHPGRRRLLGLHPWFGLPLASLPLLAWGWASWRTDGGETVRWMIDWYVLRRAGGAVFGQAGPPGTYLVVFCLLLLPWTALLPAALAGIARGVRGREPWAVGLLAWMAAGWWGYELLPSKLPAYALGAAPALALGIAGAALPASGRAPGRRLSAAGWILQTLLLVTLGGGLIAAATRLPGHGALPIGLTGGWLVGLGVVPAALALRGRASLALRIACGGTMLFFLTAWVALLPLLRPLLATTVDVAERVTVLAGPDGEAVFARNFRLPSLPFYLATAGVPYRQAAEDEDPAALLAGTVPVVAVFDEKGFVAAEPRMPAAGLTVEVIGGWIPDKGQPVRYWIVANRGPDPAEQGRGAGERAPPAETGAD
ncbi:MAG: glycosyltransferase family 39 protein, partial [Myxococcota bacterium]|nr:glycosyltransferase family 39 protein [Myxococcota bacterium]